MFAQEAVGKPPRRVGRAVPGPASAGLLQALSHPGALGLRAPCHRADDDEMVDGLGAGDRDRLGDQAAEREPHDVRPGDAPGGQQLDVVADKGVQGIGQPAPRRMPVPAQVVANDRGAGSEFGGYLVPGCEV